MVQETRQLHEVAPAPSASVPVAQDAPLPAQLQRAGSSPPSESGQQQEAEQPVTRDSSAQRPPQETAGLGRTPHPEQAAMHHHVQKQEHHDSSESFTERLSEEPRLQTPSPRQPPPDSHNEPTPESRPQPPGASESSPNQAAHKADGGSVAQQTPADPQEHTFSPSSPAEPDTGRSDTQAQRRSGLLGSAEGALPSRPGEYAAELEGAQSEQGTDGIPLAHSC